MESNHSYQLILPTDKRNPSFSLYLSEDEQHISVFTAWSFLKSCLTITSRWPLRCC